MNIGITDKDMLQGIAIADVITYIMSKGAVKVTDFAEKAMVWQYKDEELLIPFSSRYADYVLRISQMLQQIENVEGRSQWAVLHDIQHVAYDVIRVRNVSGDTKHGTLCLLKSLDFIAATKEMLFAAACSAATQKIHYAGRKPQDAERFMEAVRFGKTEQGSFILTLLSPVSPELDVQHASSEKPEDEHDMQSYERRVIPTLESGLVALNHAAQKSMIDKELQHFVDAASHGLSTNLCDAVANMYTHLSPDFIEVGITYSGNRTHQRTSAHIHVDKDYIPLIREASQKIKSREPEHEQTVRGFITKLSSDAPQELGHITVQDMSTRPRNIIIHLHGAEYARAIDAHRDNMPVEFTGTLRKSGRTTHLEPIAPFEMFCLEDE